jgi:preprotein translocase subunit Sec63
MKTGESPLVFLVLPDLRQFSRRTSREARHGKREIPYEVIAALSAFGLGESASFDDVRRAYRELVQSYHPDKVAHLGPDLRQVAETKTKEINSAYHALQNFYRA